MRPVVSTAEMAAMDAAAMQETSHEILVARAGAAVAQQARLMLGECRGAKVVVVAGTGSNGADGRVAAGILQESGAEVMVVDPGADLAQLDEVDLLIDAAFGTGLSRPYVAASPPLGTTVLAVDLPSGLDGDSGAPLGRPMLASGTVTMAAIKAGQLLGDGPELCGEVVVADIGISTADASMALLAEEDLALIPMRRRAAHKWNAAVVVVAGSAGMEGAAILSSLGVLRAGAGMCRLITPAGPRDAAWPVELVRRHVAPEDLAATASDESSRAAALLVGPGLGRSEGIRDAVRRIVAERSVPIVIDADGLAAFGDAHELAGAVASASSPVVLTPHDGELRALLDDAAAAELATDRVAVLRSLAAQTGASVLSKGPTTVVAAAAASIPSVYFSTSGSPALATAGTGDVLSGVIAAFLAMGLDGPLAAALGAYVHGRAAGAAEGQLIASELPALIGRTIWESRHGD